MPWAEICESAGHHKSSFFMEISSLGHSEQYFCGPWFGNSRGFPSGHVFWGYVGIYA